MDIRRRSLRIVALAVVVSLPLLGMSGVASAKVAKGCHKTHTCKSGGGSGSGSGTGTQPAITVQVDPNPLVETGESSIFATVQVETSPLFAGDRVHISSPQFTASCQTPIGFGSLQPGGGGGTDASVVLDDDGNVTVMMEGMDCAPGSDVVEADLAVAPYYTALGTLVANPPVVTPTGVAGFPTTSGTVTTGEVATGDTTASGESDVYAVFYVETDPVYAEQTVDINSAQLEARCGGFWIWSGTNAGRSANGTTVNTGLPPTSVLDNDGNAVFVFEGASCAAGPSEVIAEVEAGSHPTYTTTFNINAPQPTI
jgi:hypothetical protein